MHINWFAILAATIVPLIVGFIYYHPAVMGKKWMEANGFSAEDLKKGANLVLIFMITAMLSFFLAFSMQYMVIHQNHVGSILLNHPDFQNPATELGKWFADFMNTYGKEFRTFKHGAFHGILSTIFTILPVIAINALYERRGGKYIFIHFLYWMICFALMGGIICQWA